LNKLWSLLRSPKSTAEKSGRPSSLSSNEVPLDALLNHIQESVSFYDSQLKLTHVSRRLNEARGRQLAPGSDISEVYPGFHQYSLAKTFEDVLQGRLTKSVQLTREDGEVEHLLLFFAGTGVGIVEHKSNIEKRNDEQEREHVMLVHHATHDTLTGLQNRRRFSDHLQAALSTVGVSERNLALLQIDLDEFKAVNDTLGHGVGDQLLQLVATRIHACLTNSEFAYRYAGDEFAVIQSGKSQPMEAERLSESLIRNLKQPFVINGIPVFIGASVGIAFGPEHGTENEQLMKAADIALYAAKREGRGCYRVFNRSMLLLLEQRENLRRSLRTALERKELYLEYQPIVRPPSLVVGFEALLRWNHPEVGVIPPSVFIPIAEADGLMEDIGRWVLTEACRQATSWPSTLSISVNLSPAQFLSGSLTDTVAQIIDSVGIQADRIELEITESVLLEQTVDNIDTLNTLNVLGIRISLDDFGTYYSSLSYLKNFPFDNLKIDHYFIDDVETDDKSQTIVRSIINLAHGLGISVTAEGVETEGQARWLTREKCDFLQGYLLSRPLGEQATKDLIRRHSHAIYVNENHNHH
jgi:diguanylate cyclase (GGDEF)-like protein